jgi:hypothetical protein
MIAINNIYGTIVVLKKGQMSLIYQKLRKKERERERKKEKDGT